MDTVTPRTLIGAFLDNHQTISKPKPQAPRRSEFRNTPVLSQPFPTDEPHETLLDTITPRHIIGAFLDKHQTKSKPKPQAPRRSQFRKTPALSQASPTDFSEAETEVGHQDDLNDTTRVGDDDRNTSMTSEVSVSSTRRSRARSNISKTTIPDNATSESSIRTSSTANVEVPITNPPSEHIDTPTRRSLSKSSNVPVTPPSGRLDKRPSTNTSPLVLPEQSLSKSHGTPQRKSPRLKMSVGVSTSAYTGVSQSKSLSNSISNTPIKSSFVSLNKSAFSSVSQNRVRTRSVSISPSKPVTPRSTRSASRHMSITKSSSSKSRDRSHGRSLSESPVKSSHKSLSKSKRKSQASPVLALPKTLLPSTISQLNSDQASPSKSPPGKAIPSKSKIPVLSRSSVTSKPSTSTKHTSVWTSSQSSSRPRTRSTGSDKNLKSKSFSGSTDKLRNDIVDTTSIAAGQTAPRLKEKQSTSFSKSIVVTDDEDGLKERTDVAAQTTIIRTRKSDSKSVASPRKKTKLNEVQEDLSVNRQNFDLTLEDAADLNIGNVASQSDKKSNKMATVELAGKANESRSENQTHVISNRSQASSEAATTQDKSDNRVKSARKKGNRELDALVAQNKLFDNDIIYASTPANLHVATNRLTESIQEFTMPTSENLISNKNKHRNNQKRKSIYDHRRSILQREELISPQTYDQFGTPLSASTRNLSPVRQPRPSLYRSNNALREVMSNLSFRGYSNLAVKNHQRLSELRNEMSLHNSMETMTEKFNETENQPKSDINIRNSHGNKTHSNTSLINKSKNPKRKISDTQNNPRSQVKSSKDKDKSSSNSHAIEVSKRKSQETFVPSHSPNKTREEHSPSPTKNARLSKENISQTKHKDATFINRSSKVREDVSVNSENTNVIRPNLFENFANITAISAVSTTGRLSTLSDSVFERNSQPLTSTQIPNRARNRTVTLETVKEKLGQSVLEGHRQLHGSHDDRHNNTDERVPGDNVGSYIGKGKDASDNLWDGLANKGIAFADDNLEDQRFYEIEKQQDNVINHEETAPLVQKSQRKSLIMDSDREDIPSVRFAESSTHVTDHVNEEDAFEKNEINTNRITLTERQQSAKRLSQISDDELTDDDNEEENEDVVAKDDVQQNLDADEDLPVPSTSRQHISSKRRKPRKKRSSDQMLQAYTSRRFRHWAGCHVNNEVMENVHEAVDIYWDNLVGDLEAYTLHAGRKTCTERDVELLMKRQKLITPECGMYALVHKYMPLEMQEKILPLVRGKNT